ncbi:hypothetical protein ACFOPN_04315 [Xanthomonas hyacinthi]|uniref:hypothetical protein n=1 Tax=Xanthomonas hyacinthi TaxID=56455 RepID=UPI003614ADC2
MFARCRFCSETLRPHAGGTAVASLPPSPPDHFAMLRQGLAPLSALPPSQSGLDERRGSLVPATAGDAGRGRMRRAAGRAARALYSNGAGSARGRGDALLHALQRFRLSWLALSRQPPQQAGNDAIMRFRDGAAIANASPVRRLPLPTRRALRPRQRLAAAGPVAATGSGLANRGMSAGGGIKAVSTRLRLSLAGSFLPVHGHVRFCQRPRLSRARAGRDRPERLLRPQAGQPGEGDLQFR